MATEILSNDEPATMDDYAAADFDALFSEAQTKELESIAQSWGVNRRLAIATLSRSKAQLVDGVTSEEMAELLVSMTDDFSEYIQHLQDQIEMVNTATVRILSAMATVAKNPSWEAGKQ